jgi:hypothetical protein
MGKEIGWPTHRAKARVRRQRRLRLRAAGFSAPQPARVAAGLGRAEQ